MKVSRGLIDLLSYHFVARDKDSSVKGTIRPAVDSTYNLGSDGRRFSTIYADTIDATSIIGGAVGNADTVDGLHASATPTANYLLALDASLHFPTSVYDQALLLDGSRTLTGNLAVSTGVTIDGVDISDHVGNVDIHADHTSISITAGDGLTGGGTIDNSRTITMGTPGSSTVSSTNAVTTSSHTHNVDTTTTGEVSKIVATDSNGYIRAVRVGIGLSGAPSSPLHIRSTSTPQINFGYDATYYSQLSVASDGDLTLNHVGVNLYLSPVTDTVNAEYHLGGANATTTTLTFNTATNTPSIYSTDGNLYLDMPTDENLYIKLGNTSTAQMLVYPSDWSGAVFRLYADGDVEATRIGVGVHPTFPFMIRDATTAQLRLEYDATTYTSFTVNSSNRLLIANYGETVLYNNVGDNNFYVRGVTDNASLFLQSNYDNLGSANSAVYFYDYNLQKYIIYKDADNDLKIYDTANTRNIFHYDITDSSLRLDPANYISQTAGWQITGDGHADFRYIYADELRVEAFTAAVYMALVGALTISKSRSRIAETFYIPITDKTIVGVDQTDDYFSISGDWVDKIPLGVDMYIKVTGSTGNNGEYAISDVQYDAINDETDIYISAEIPDATVDGYLFGRSTLRVEDVEGYEDIQVFQNNDWVRLKHMDMSGGGLIVTDIWFTLYGYDNETVGDGQQRWYAYAVDDGGIPGAQINPGAVVLDYGQSGDGLWEATVLDQNYSPYSQVTTWVTDASVGTNYTVHTRVGNLEGITSVAEYGLWAGEGTTNTDGQIIASDSRLTLRNMDLTIHDGSYYVIKLDRTTPAFMLASDVSLMDYSTTTGIWMGYDVTTYKFRLGNPSGKRFVYNGTDIYLFASSGNYIRTDGTSLLFYSNSAQVIGLNTPNAGDAIFGSSSAGNMIWDSSDTTLYFRDATTRKIGIESDGDIKIGSNIDTINLTYFSVFTTGQTYNGEAMGAGDMLLWSNSSGYANMYFDYSAGTMAIRRGTTDILSVDNTSDLINIPGSMLITGSGQIGNGNTVFNTSGIDLDDDTLSGRGYTLDSYFNTGTGEYATDWLLSAGYFHDLTITVPQQTSGIGTGEEVELVLHSNSNDSTEYFRVNIADTNKFEVAHTKVTVADELEVNGSFDLNGGGTYSGTQNFAGALQRSGTTGYILIPLTTPINHTSFNGTNYSTVATATKIENTSWTSTIPATAQALLIQIQCYDTGTLGTTGLYFNVGPSSTYWYACAAIPPGGSVRANDTQVVPCVNGDIWYRISASGTNTMNVTLRIWGYFI
jgi:hypothetical protein